MLKRRNRLAVLLSVCTPVLAGAAAWGQTTTYTAINGNHLWGTGGNWSNNVPAAGGTAIFDNTAYSSPTLNPGLVNLGGVTRTVDTLEFDNPSFLSNPNYTLSNGTLAINHLISTGSLSPGNRISANVVASSATLSADLRTQAVTYIDGVLTATSIDLTNGVPGFNQATLQLSNAANQITGTISVGDSIVLNATTPGALGTATISIATNGVLSVFTNGAVSNYGNNIRAGLGSSINSDIPPTVLNSPGTSKFGTLTMEHDAYVFMRGFDTTSQSFTSTTLDGDNMFYPAFLFNPQGSGSDPLGNANLGAVHEGTAGSKLTNNGPGMIKISGASDYTGGTLASGGIIDAAADGALGHGLVQINENAALRLAYQTAGNFNATNIDAYGAIGGDLSGAHYSGASRNVTAAPNTIFYSMTPGTAPVRGVDVATPAYLAGITDNAQTITVGDNSTSIYYGVAFGLYSPNGTFAGSVSESSAGQGVSVYTTTGFANLGAAAFNTVSGPAGAGGVNFFGPGEIRFTAPLLGTASVYNVSGSPTAVTDTNFVVSLYGANTLAAGKTINVRNGVLQVGDGRSLATGSVVNVLDTGSLYFGDYGVTGVAAALQHGTVNFQSGSAAYVTTQTSVPAGGASYNWSPNSLLILANPLNTGSPTWISPNSDVVAESGGAFTGAGIVLGNGRRLTTPIYDITLIGGTGISAAAGATQVLLTATNDTTLEVDDAVNLTGVDLQIGDANVFNGVSSYTARASLAQDGAVILGGASVVRNLTVAAGDLTVDGQLRANNFAHNSTGTTTFEGASPTFTGTITQSAGTVIDRSTITYGAATNTTITGGELRFMNAAKPTLPANALSVTIGAAGALSALGSADPFSDAASHRMSIINNGALTIGTTSNISTLTGAGTTTVNSAGSITADSIRQGTLQLNSNATAIVRASGHAPSVGTPTINVVNALSLGAGAQLNINDGDLIVKYTGASPIGAIAAALKTGYHNGNWDGVGIASTSAGSDSSKMTGLGYAEASELGYTTFNGEPVTSQSVLVKYTYYGDSSLDGKVDLGNDFNLFLGGYIGHASGWDQGDYNYDGVVDNADFTLFIDGYAGQGGSLGVLEQIIESGGELTVAQKATILSVVPEPTSLMAISAAACAFATTRRNKRRR